MHSDNRNHLAVYPGSFDPLTVGHMDVALRASKLFDQVIVAVAADAEKQHLFSVAQRVAMAEDACCGVPNISVDSFEGLVVDYASARGAVTLVKGLRAVSDSERELQMYVMNRHLAPELDTAYLMAIPEHAFVSSSLVRHVHQLGGDVSRFVTPFVLDMLDRQRDGERDGHTSGSEQEPERG